METELITMETELTTSIYLLIFVLPPVVAAVLAAVLTALCLHISDWISEKRRRRQMRDAKATLMCTEILVNKRTLNSDLWTKEIHWQYRDGKVFSKITYGLPGYQCCQSFLDSIHTFKLSRDVQAILSHTLDYIDSVKVLHTFCIPPHPIEGTTFLTQTTSNIRKHILQQSDILLKKIEDFWPQAASIEIPWQKDENANDKEPQASPKTEA